jgi:hypothetical protein
MSSDVTGAVGLHLYAGRVEGGSRISGSKRLRDVVDSQVRGSKASRPNRLVSVEPKGRQTINER